MVFCPKTIGIGTGSPSLTFQNREATVIQLDFNKLTFLMDIVKLFVF